MASEQQSSMPNASDVSGTEAPRLEKFHSSARSNVGATSLFYFDTLEHAALGNKLYLTIPKAGGGSETWYTGANDHVFNASTWGPEYNKQCLSYGHINALAGDFYGIDKPISGAIGEKPSDDEMKARFMSAFDLMFKDPNSVTESQQILNEDFHIENDPYDKWLPKLPGLGKQPSWIFATKMMGGYDQIKAFNKITKNRNWNGKTYPDYETLLKNNFDHFGQDALKVYAIGHELALEVAANAGKAQDETQLWRAYAMNAYAEHFLEDSFSSGHIRTPRRLLHSSWNPAWDPCANLQHEEDGALGVRVHTKADPNTHWTCYGDSYLHDTKAKDTKDKCHNALQTSANEIWNAYDKRAYSKDHDSYMGIQLAPIADDGPDPNHPNHPAPLFIVKDNNIWQRNWTKDNIARRSWDKSTYLPYKDFSGWTAAGTYATAYTSGWWKYEMSMDSKGSGN